MKLGKQGLDLIKEFEGLHLRAYLCPAKVWTIGYGHTKSVRRGQTITESKANKLLKEDVKWVEEVVSKEVTVSLTQPQYDALCSFIYNVGGGAFKKSTLLRKLNSGDYEGAEGQFKRWNKANGVVLRGLTRRREAERALFGSKPSATTSTTTEGPLAALLAALMALLATLFKNRS